MSKIIVTGGAGYIGSHTIIELIENTDFEIISIDNFSNSSAKTYDRIEQITKHRVKSYNVDLCDLEETEKVFQNEKDIVGIIHFAAFKSVPESVANPHKYYHNNINSLLNVLELCVKYKVNNFIFSSSCSVYGNISTLPVDENTPLNKALSPYAYTKQIGERILEDYSKVHSNLKIIALRYFNPVGAHQSKLIGEITSLNSTILIPVITKFAIGDIDEMYVNGIDYGTKDGTCVRDYIHVSDVANAHVLAQKYLLDSNLPSNFEIINIGLGNGISVLEAIDSFERVSGLKLNYKINKRREGDVEAIYSDTKKIAKILSWTPKFNLDQMISSAWEWEKKLKSEIS